MKSIVRSVLTVGGCALVMTAMGCDEPQKAQQVQPPKAAAKAQPKAPAQTPTASAKPNAPAKAPAEAAPDKPPTAPASKTVNAALEKAAEADKDKPQGIVADKKFTGDYTYIRIKVKDKEDIWVAAAKYRGDIGDKVLLPDPKVELVMADFHSKAFDYTFKEIYFVRDLMRPGEAALMAQQKVARQPASRPSSAPDPAAQRKILEAQAAKQGLPGKVMEVLQVDEYTYLKVNTGFKEAWVASTKIEVAVGDKIQVKNGTLMNKFHSKTLNRTFDEIYFANAVVIPKDEAPAKTPKAAGP